MAGRQTVKSDIWQVLRVDLARRLAAMRARGITQQQIAEIGGLDRNNYVSRLFKQPNPSLDTVVRVLWGLGVKPSEFFAQLEEQCPTPEPEWAAAANARPPITNPAAADHDVAAPRARLVEIQRATLHAYHLARASLLDATDDRSKTRRGP